MAGRMFAGAQGRLPGFFDGQKWAVGGLDGSTRAGCGRRGLLPRQFNVVKG